jgi:endogenous inhibitor of DNA gyrase (YacG/DUF329 family)
MTGEASTTITVTCPRCGDRRLPPAAFTLVWTAADPTRAFYAFTCPGCERPVNQAAPSGVWELLRGAGVAVCVLDGPPASCPATPLTEAEISGWGLSAATVRFLVPLAAHARTTQ